MSTDPFEILKQVVEEKGYSYEVVNERIWRFFFTGKHMAEIDVLAVWQGQLFIIGAILIARQFLKYDGELMQHLLLLNNNLDRVKVGYNQENMLFVRSDISLRTMDAQEFVDHLEQVSAAADYIYNAIQPYLVEDKSPAS